MNELWETFKPVAEVAGVVVAILGVCLFAVLVMKAADDFWYANKDAKHRADRP